MEKDRLILIVDDDDRNIFALSAVMRAKGFKIEIAHNGKIGLETLKNNPKIDLVLMDIMMPVMDGYETIHKIRMDQQYKHIPIIALTAKAMKGDEEKCMKAGATSYCSKPVDIDELLEKIDNCLLKTL